MIALLTEAGSGIGFGHLTRMYALGEALRAEGAVVRMLVQWAGPPLLNVVPRADWIIQGDWREDVAGTLRYEVADTVVIDSYRLDASGYAVAGQGRRLVVIDDYYRLPYPADLVINPNVYGDTGRYLPQAKAAISGIEHVIVRPPFRAAAANFVAKPELQRVLLTLGGSDVHGLGPQLCEALAAQGLRVDWVAPDCAASMSLPEAVTRLGPQDAAGICDLILRNDLTVCGGGQTLHELACLGAPCVAVELGDDQKGNLACYEGHGFINAQRIHWAEPEFLASVVAQVQAMRYQAARATRGGSGAKLVDGGGVTRLARRIMALRA